MFSDMRCVCDAVVPVDVDKKFVPTVCFQLGIRAEVEA